MRPLVTPEEMRRADEAAISAGERVEILMERAGRAVGRAVIRVLGRRYGGRVAVVCGKGNNGGDGFVTARVLHQEGVRVVCCTTFDPADADGAAAHHLALLRASGCIIRRFDERLLDADVIVDGLFGTGFHGELRGETKEAVRAMWRMARAYEVLDEGPESVAVPVRSPRPRVVSIDVPSAGVVPADLTVALAAEKYETFFADPEDAMLVEVADIGISIEQARVHVVEREDVVNDIPRLEPDDHKTSHGSVVVIAGSDETTGAALLTARAAARMGAGYVTLVSTGGVIDAAQIRLPEILKIRVAPAGSLGPDALDAAASAIDRADAIAIGPGLGTGAQQTALVERCLRELEKPLILDADALNVLAGGTALIQERDRPCVVTPHAAEMGRLLQIDTAAVADDRVTAVLRAAEELGCTVVLKGRNTLVAAPGSAPADRAFPDSREHAAPAMAFAVPVGGPELATAGTGDVLTGAMAAAMAVAATPERAAMACYVHGVAGAIAAERSGLVGLVAWDVAEALPAAIEAVRAPYSGSP